MIELEERSVHSYVSKTFFRLSFTIGSKDCCPLPEELKAKLLDVYGEESFFPPYLDWAK